MLPSIPYTKTSVARDVRNFPLVDAARRGDPSVRSLAASEDGKHRMDDPIPERARTPGPPL
jgi:hypothetical protein